MDRERMIDVLKMDRDLALFDPTIGECRPTNELNAESAEALDMAIKELEGKDINVPANSALDHIHNVVAEREYQRGYEQGKADANHPENLDSWIPVSEKLPKSNPEDLEYPTVIICLKDGTVELGCFYESTKEWGTGEDFDRLVNPVAWMPLPEPWEGEQHETD